MWNTVVCYSELSKVNLNNYLLCRNDYPNILAKF